jgi:hypothetical protein
MKFDINYSDNVYYCTSHLKLSKISKKIASLYVCKFFLWEEAQNGKNRGLQRNGVYLGWPIAPSETSPNAGGWDGG